MASQRRKRPDSGITWPWEEDAPTEEDRKRLLIQESVAGQAVMDYLEQKMNEVGYGGLTPTERKIWDNIHGAGRGEPASPPTPWEITKTAGKAAYAVGYSFYAMPRELIKGNFSDSSTHPWTAAAKKLGLKISKAEIESHREYIEGKPARQKPAGRVKAVSVKAVSSTPNPWYEREYRKFKDEQWERSREEMLEESRKMLMRAMAADPKVWEPKPRRVASASTSPTKAKPRPLAEQRRSGR